MADLDATEAALHALTRAGVGVLTLRDDRPDETERNLPAVDFVAVGDGRLLVIEHTRVGAFPAQEQLEAELMRHFGPISSAVEGRLPDDASFALSVSAVKPPRIGRHDAEGMTAWVVSTAPSLSLPPNHYADSPDGEVTARLYRQPLLGGPQLRLSVGVVPADLEADRRVRITKALADKLPKLEDARTIHGATDTLLVLESPDLALSNAWDIAAAVRSCVDGLPLPDHIVLVERDYMSTLLLGGTWQEVTSVGRPDAR